MSRKLVAVDEAAVIADYEADVTVKTICATHQLLLTRLYRILTDDHTALAGTTARGYDLDKTISYQIDLHRQLRRQPRDPRRAHRRHLRAGRRHQPTPT